MKEHSNYWSTQVADPLIVDSASAQPWDAEYDVLVIGLGVAGVSAALQATELGGNVAAIDRYSGGGASAVSGNVVYLGGGTRNQIEAGIEDSADNMFNYLAHETRDAVSEETLRRFCDGSVETFNWLESQGVEFPGNACPYKTGYPLFKYRLYFSGNENTTGAKAVAKPVQRGHIPKGMGRFSLMGQPALMTPLRASAKDKGVSMYMHSDVRRLVQDRSGRVLGAEVWRIPTDHPAAIKQAKLAKKLKLPAFMPKKRAARLQAKYEALEKEYAEPIYLRGIKGVVLSAGGFVFNRDLVMQHAPKYEHVTPLGTYGDNGAGILLGQSVGAETAYMEQISAWKFLDPPHAWSKAMLVNNVGHRIVDETSYGAVVGKAITENNGEGMLILDKPLMKQSKKDLSLKKCQPSHLLLGYLASFKAKKGNSIEELAQNSGIDQAGLVASVEAYNKVANSNEVDQFGKASESMQEISEGPFYALDLSTINNPFGISSITTGGLCLNETSGQVQSQGGAIPGLYAAGRNAVGIPTLSYVSGLSLSDGIFSGRRAARHIMGTETKLQTESN